MRQSRYVDPGRIFGPIWFVGTHEASTHLIETGDGLILIDPGCPDTLHISADGKTVQVENYSTAKGIHYGEGLTFQLYSLGGNANEQPVNIVVIAVAAAAVLAVVAVVIVIVVKKKKKVTAE